MRPDWRHNDPWFGFDNEIRQPTPKCGCLTAVLLILTIMFAGLCIIGYIYVNMDIEEPSQLQTTTIPTPSPPPRRYERMEESRACRFSDKTKSEIKSWIQKEIQANRDICSKNRLGREEVRKIIKDEIKREHLDSMKPDFASSSAGAAIISASDTWQEGYSNVYFLFVPIKSLAPAPSTILEPWHQAGDCWPMKGSQGHVMIQLAARARVVGFTLEHIDQSVSLSGSTPEAPNNFTVYGIDDPTNYYGYKHMFGKYQYDNKREEKQYFRVQNTIDRSFAFIELAIKSNHGQQYYTCIYRFQVHGNIDKAYHCN